MKMSDLLFHEDFHLRLHTTALVGPKNRSVSIRICAPTSAFGGALNTVVDVWLGKTAGIARREFSGSSSRNTSIYGWKFDFKILNIQMRASRTWYALRTPRIFTSSEGKGGSQPNCTVVLSSICKTRKLRGTYVGAARKKKTCQLFN